MPDKQWMLTKIVVSALSLVTLISVCLGGAIFIFDVKEATAFNMRDIQENKELVYELETEIDGDLELIRRDNKEFEKEVDKSFKENAEAHKELVETLHAQALMMRDLTGIMTAIENKVESAIYETRINGSKIDGLYNPDHEDGKNGN